MDTTIFSSPFMWLILLVTISAVVIAVRKVLHRLSSETRQSDPVSESLHILLYLSGATILLGLFGYVATLYSSVCRGAAMPGSGLFSIIVIPADHPGLLTSLAQCYSKSTGIGMVGMSAAMLIGLLWFFTRSTKKI